VWGDGWLGVLGLEPTIELYVEHLVEIFKEIRRVLRKDGTVWINLGDSYAGSWGNHHPTGKGGQRPKATERFQREAWGDKSFKPPMADAPGLKPKDLCMIPARVALALQADGWWVRSQIIWAKPNPMPESVTDRPTTAHEYIFLLTKSARYFWDAEAVRENVSGTAHARQAKDGSPPSLVFKMQDAGNGNRNNPSFQSYMKDLPPEAGRNLRSVWEIPTHAFPDAHFATFSPEIPLRCIKAGTSEKGCCPKCGAPWIRIVEKVGHDPTGAYGSNNPGKGSRMFVDRDPAHDRPKSRKNYGGKWSGTHSQEKGHRMLDNMKAARDHGGEHDNPFIPSQTLGWKPSCKCLQAAHPGKALTGAEWLALIEKTAKEFKPKPCIVFDQFSGAGTTALVADKLGRIGIGLDLKFDYCRMAQNRIYKDAPLLAKQGEDSWVK